MLKRFFICFSVLFVPALIFAGSPIRPCPTDGVEEIYVNGGLMLTSTKTNTVTMYNTLPDVEDNCNFFVIIENETPHHETFYAKNLRVTDQDGYRLPVVSKRKMKKRMAHKAGVSKFIQEMGHAMERGSAEEDAGEIEYRSVSSKRKSTRIDRRTPGIRSEERIRVDERTVERGREFSPSLRRQELREIEEKQKREDIALERVWGQQEQGVEDNYLATHTIFPGEVYARHFQVTIPKESRRHLKEMRFTFEFGGEQHTFVYAVLPKKRGFWW